MGKEKGKRNLQKPNDPNKPKKEKNITIEGTPLGTITEKNSAFNQVKRDLFETAKKGNFSYEGNAYSSILERLRGKGFSIKEDYEEYFGRKAKSVISWEKAFPNLSEIDLDNYPIDSCNLAQLLYITSYRARKKIKEVEKNKDLGESR